MKNKDLAEMLMMEPDAPAEIRTPGTFRVWPSDVVGVGKDQRTGKLYIKGAIYPNDNTPVRRRKDKQWRYE